MEANLTAARTALNANDQRAALRALILVRFESGISRRAHHNAGLAIHAVGRSKYALALTYIAAL